ncbi:ATP-dependent permease [Ophidiomyces ophidiicola]|nr:ATP-dependent permease [Ophidiomyces ophidiicola]KAI1984384.1 ATP-dependent permease [Ophidiomyces ophidiicola]KAI1995971.1 ATP-dependent permease [Ophidiomyces ophidiicola]KAI2003498.1 ATP-dependent permease [Ophidiomyces ophidiicola]
MAWETPSNDAASGSAPADASPPERRWRALFLFTTRRHLAPLSAGLFFAICGGLAVPLLAVILGRIFNELTSFGARSITAVQLMHNISILCVYLLALGCTILAIQSFHFSLWIIFGELQAKKARNELFEVLLGKEVEWFDLTRDGVGALLPRIQTNIRDLQLAVSQPLGSFFQNLVAAMAGLILALYISWNLTFVCLATVPVCAIVISVMSKKVQPEIDSQRRELDQASKSATNAISSIDVVKYLNGQAIEVAHYMSAVQAAAQHYLKQARFTAVEIGLIHLLTFGMFVQGFWYGGYLVAIQKLTPGQVLTTFWACFQATQSIENIIPQLLVLEKGRAAAAALKQILGQAGLLKSVRVPEAESKCPQFCEGNIKFENVTFAYPSQPDRLVLDGCTFLFPSGDMTFIVGRSGSGKSTVGNLLLRFYLPASGEISIDGNSITSLDINWVRNNITLVQQQSSLFNETILKNIAFGSRDFDNLSPNDIENCISFAKLLETIQALPDGLDTIVGLGGDRLSGGQRQRVALARSRLRDTPILVLDESTSALDYHTRRSIMSSIREWRKGKTTIVITHDLSQIDEKDFVYVMDNGKVYRQGQKQTLQNDIEGVLLSASQAPIQNNSEKLKSISRARLSAIDHWNDSRRQSFPGFSNFDHTMDGHSSLAFSPVPYSPLFSQPLGLSQTQSAIFPNQQRHSFHGKLPLSRNAVDLPTKEILPFEENQGVKSLSQIDETRDEDEELPSRPNSLDEERYGYQSRSLFGILCTLTPSLSRSEKALLFLGFVSAFFHAAATPAFAFLFSRLLSTFYLTERRARAALECSIGILGVSIGNGIASFWMHFLLERCGHAWVDHLRQEAMFRILQQPKFWFEKDINHPSTLANYLDRNAEEMRNLVGRFAGFMFVATVMMVMGTTWGLAICWRLTLVGCACAPVLYALTRLFERVSGYWESRCNRAAEVVSGIFSETFLNIRIVRSLTLESYFHKKLLRANSETLTIGMKRGCFTGCVFGLSEASIIFVYALVFYYGALLVSSMQYTTKAVLTVFSMLLFSMANVKAVLSLVPQISSSRDTATQVLHLAKLQADHSHEHHGKIHTSQLAPIRFTNVNFSYPSQPEKLILHDFNLNIDENACTAIVGPSGSGKSTIASILLALYPISKENTGYLRPPGLIALGGLDLREIHVSSLRSQIAIVPQKATIFPASIRDNISYGLEESSPYNTLANVRTAAKAAGIDDFISSLPSGYNTLIGDGGIGISGGQAQRLTIARALVRRPRVLILDEATSSLDIESAAGIQRTVQKLMGRNRSNGLTVIIITHAREMMEIADKVVVIGDGRVVEEGAFELLINKRGGELRKLLGITGRENL